MALSTSLQEKLIRLLEKSLEEEENRQLVENENDLDESDPEVRAFINSTRGKVVFWINLKDVATSLTNDSGYSLIVTINWEDTFQYSENVLQLINPGGILKIFTGLSPNDRPVTATAILRKNDLTLPDQSGQDDGTMEENNLEDYGIMNKKRKNINIKITEIKPLYNPPTVNLIPPGR